MPTLICRNCGKQVRVQGLAAMCPQCGFLVTAGEDRAASDKSPASPSEKPARKKKRSLAAPVVIDEPQPDWLLDQHREDRRKRMVMIFGIAGGLALLLSAVFVSIKLLRSMTAPPPPVAVAPALPPRPPPASAPVEQLPASQPVPASKPVIPPPPVVVTTQAVEKPPPGPFAGLSAVVPVQSSESPVTVTDAQIGDSIHRGVDFLFNRMITLNPTQAGDTSGGVLALGVYALLHAGQAIDDPRITLQNPDIKRLLTTLKATKFDEGSAVYSHSLRLSALGVNGRVEDRDCMTNDIDYLLKASMSGAYTYQTPPPGTKREAGSWDNSNSQYGALGIWAASEAGFAIPASYWANVESHWLAAQCPDGGWGYHQDSTGKLSMTAAGVTMLFVARSQLAPDAPLPDRAVQARALSQGLAWLGAGANAVTLGEYPGYTRYGIERAGLASGYKYFGDHDWYLELAADAIKHQQQDGSWLQGNYSPKDLIDTSFTLLFLSRGRHPVFMAKLRFNGHWNNKPRDVAQLTLFGSDEIERPLNWQVVDIDRPWRDWTDSPVLYIASDEPLHFNDDQVEKLRQYVRAGGMIFTHADRGRDEFNQSVDALVSRLWPGETLRPLADDDPIFNVFSPQAQKHPPLTGVSNGVRLLLVHSPTDFSKLWQRHANTTNRPSMEAGMNVVIYASGKRDFINRVSSPILPAPQANPLATVPLARLSYDGAWDPEPGGWERFPRRFQYDTSVALAIRPLDVHQLNHGSAVVAHLTGIAAPQLDDDAINALRTFVDQGGVLFIDACGGATAFRDAIHADLIPRLKLDSPLVDLPPTHPILSGRLAGTERLPQPRVRGFVSEKVGKKFPPLQWTTLGKGAIVVSDLDVTSGLLGTNTWPITGWTPAYAQSLTRNVILWAMSRQQ